MRKIAGALEGKASNEQPAAFSLTAPPGGEDGKCRRLGKFPAGQPREGGMRSHAADGKASFVLSVGEPRGVDKGQLGRQKRSWRGYT